MKPKLNNRKRKAVRVVRWQECSECRCRLKNFSVEIIHYHKYLAECRCSLWSKKWISADYEWENYKKRTKK